MRSPRAAGSYGTYSTLYVSNSHVWFPVFPGKPKDHAPSNEEEKVADETEKVSAPSFVIRGVLFVLVVLHRVLARARDTKELAVLLLGAGVASGARLGPARRVVELDAAGIRRIVILA